MASEYGTGARVGTSVAGAIGAAADTVGLNVGPDGMTDAQLQTIAESNADGVSAIRALRTTGTDLEKGDAAYTMVQALRKAKPEMSEKKAAAFAAKTFGLDSAFLATDEGVAYVRSNLERDAKALMPAGAGELGLRQTKALVEEAIRRQLGARGDGGAALKAERQRQAAQKLTPSERADLKLYLGALQNDGRAVAGEMVSLAGGAPETITAEQVAAGKRAFQKAQKYDDYDAEDAHWFDEDLLRMYGDKVDRSAEAEEKRRLAFERGARTPEEVEQEMAEHFVRSAKAARDLEDYIPLSAEGINSSFEAKVIGGATHIARREAAGVFDLDAHHEDRKRRLGGRGPVASAPLRWAQKAYGSYGGGLNKGITDDQMREAVQQLKSRFRDPEKAAVALQYLFAMQYVNDAAASNGSTPEPTVVEDDAPPPPPPVAPAPPLGETPAPEGIGDIPRGGSRPDSDRGVIREALPPTGAGASRAAKPAPAGVQDVDPYATSDGTDPYATSDGTDPYATSATTPIDDATLARLERQAAGRAARAKMAGARDTAHEYSKAVDERIDQGLTAADVFLSNLPRTMGDTRGTIDRLGNPVAYTPSAAALDRLSASGVDTTPLPFGAGRGLDHSLVGGSGYGKASPIRSAITPGTAFPAIGHASAGNRQYAKVVPGTEQRAPERDVRLDFNLPVNPDASRFDSRAIRAAEAEARRAAKAGAQYAHEQAVRDHLYAGSPGRVAVDEAMFQRIARQRIEDELLAQARWDASQRQTGSRELSIQPTD